jgi:superfamily II DNA or RNA helicase
MQFAAGDRVMVRGERWVVDEAAEFTDCTALKLSAAGLPGSQAPLRERLGAETRTCELLLPFDRPVRLTELRRIRAVGRRLWMRHLHATLSELRTVGELRAAAGAAIDILPFQLEPALALIMGRASRFLLADEVGLGKTIQAGLMLAELQRRGWCERALILTPSGLRRQWADELQRRFAIDAAVIDSASLSALASTLPPDVNPWSLEGVSITSIDFVKQPEVLQGLSSQSWDMVIVDEAHLASAPSQRYQAAHLLTTRSRHVVLLTATPHAGDDASYRALCDLGRLGGTDPMVLFRRTRAQANVPRTRRVHLLRVGLGPHATELHRVLALYVARLWQIARVTGRHDVRLVAMVLSKRAFSSARSLASSVERRLSAISGQAPWPAQSALPFEPETDFSDDAPFPVAPAFVSLSEEEAALRQLLEAARRAQEDEGKMHVLRRLLRRVKEPIIIFTEYRDTLETLERAFRTLRRTTVLHGGRTPQERRDAVEAFASGRADLLLATDAGAEGLNLQSRCRLVVNLELPWSPTRLEQRIGRVDRIGQSRTVHALNLFADGTAESTVLAALLRRLDRIQASEIEIAASVIDRAPLPVRSTAVPGAFSESVDLQARAHAEGARLERMRSTLRIRSSLAEGVIPVTCIRSRAITSGACAIWFVRVRIANRAGRLVEDALVPIAVPDAPNAMARVTGTMRRRVVRARAERLVDDVGPLAVAVATQVARDRAKAIGAESAEWVRRAVRREDHLSRAASNAVAPLVQAGLFDNRAIASSQDAQRQQRRFIDHGARRSALLEASATACLAHEPQIALILIPCWLG